MTKEKIYIFGAGNFADKVYEILKEYYEIIGFIDNDVNKVGKVIHNKTICSVSRLNNSDKKVIIASSWASEIEKQLNDINYYNYEKMYSIDYCKLYLQKLIGIERVYTENSIGKIGDKKRLLIWFDGGYSVFIESYLKGISAIDNLEIFVIQSSKSKKYSCIYTRINLENIEEYNEFILSSNKFDIIHMHYVSTASHIIVDNIRSKCAKFIISIWGSDFHQASMLDKKKQERIYYLSDRITFANEKMYEEFIEEYGEDYSKKCSIRRFGLPILDEVDKIKREKNYKERLMEKYNIPKGKIIINIGHTAIMEDQHLAIINQLKNSKIKDDLFFIFPLSFGPPNKELYIKEIKKQLIKNNFKFLLIEEVVTNEEIAEIKLLLDIYVNLIENDNLSGSMLEALYAGVYVVFGNWLTYDMLSKKNMVSVSEINEINNAISNCIDNLDKLRDIQEENIKIVRQLGGCEICSERWVELIKTNL